MNKPTDNFGGDSDSVGKIAILGNAITKVVDVVEHYEGCDTTDRVRGGSMCKNDGSVDKGQALLGCPLPRKGAIAQLRDPAACEGLTRFQGFGEICEHRTDRSPLRPGVVRVLAGVLGHAAR